MSESPSSRYVMPTKPMAQRMWRLSNSLVAAITKMGISVYGSRVLYVRGRKSGAWRSTPVNPLSLDGKRYLVSPRGQTQWVRNMRVAGGGELHVGRRVEQFIATELPDDVKPPVLREYLRRWKFEVGMFFEDVTPDSPDERLLQIAPGFPVFQLTPRPE